MSEKCKQLHQWFNSLERISFPFDERKIPCNGIYILFEKGETAHCMDRIVRIGTHKGENQLRSRLKQHFIKENQSCAGVLHCKQTVRQLQMIMKRQQKRHLNL